MTSRAEILAETLARLEAERYTPVPPRSPCAAPISREQGLLNQQILLEAISGPADDDTSPDEYVGGWIRKGGILRPVKRGAA